VSSGSFVSLARSPVCGGAGARGALLSAAIALGCTPAGLSAQQLTPGTSNADSKPAELVLVGAHIRTPSGWSSAMAIHRGVIVALGDEGVIRPFEGPQTRVVRLSGQTVMPGLHDVHVHPLYGGLMELRCRIPQGSSLPETLGELGSCAARLGPLDWLIGGQWDMSALGEIPNRSQLDGVSAGHPALIEDTSGHSAWANSRALALAHITRSTPNPPGGIIERDFTGELTGILREDSAIDLVQRQIPKPPADVVRASLAWSLRTMLSFGITSFTEAAVGFAAGALPELDAYTSLADAGVLKQRVILCLQWSPGASAQEAVIAMRNLYVRDRISPSCIKIFLDGVPTDSHTAAMLEPYVGTVAGRNDRAARYGLLLVKPEVLNKAVARFDRMGLTVKFHAAGDASVRAGLDAIEAARKANGFSGLMHNVGHCPYVAQVDLPRARAIGATFEVSPYLWAPTPIGDSMAAAVGPERTARVWPVREMLDAGALVVPGSDWAVVPSVNPWIGIETLITREVPAAGARSYGIREAITREEALQMFTANSARQERTSNEVGRLEVGMLADFIVLDQNPYEVPVTRLHATKVLMTFIGGEKVFDTTSERLPR
jgi:predicted amidohydrolase YtcJ